MLTKFTLVIRSQYIHIFNYYVVHLKVIQYYMPIISRLLKYGVNWN